MSKDKFRVLGGGLSSDVPQNLPPPLSGGVTIGSAPRLPVLSARDIVQEVELLEGNTYVFTKGEGSKWCVLRSDFDLLGFSLLKQIGTDRWGPVAGARVVFRTQEGNREVADLCTRADGATVQIVAGAIRVRSGNSWRVEVEAPGCVGDVARVVMHTIFAE